MSNDFGTPRSLTRPVMVRLNDDGSHAADSVTSSSDFKIRALCCVPSRLVVPVIFLPGIMGTRLRVTTRPNTAAWFPPESKFRALLMTLQHLGRNAAFRQELLNPNTTEVDDDGPAHPDPAVAKLMGDAPGATDPERGRWRGWGQLHAESYGEILGTLEHRLAAILTDGTRRDPCWQAAVMDWQTPEKLGAQKAFTPLDDAALQRIASAFFPVHAVGYNWLRSNQDSARHLAGQIQRILKHYTERKKLAEQVILVTHSMGGLVARACCRLPGMQDKVMGVVHGVMPAIGAPASYKRMRAGFEGIAQVILGRNAAEATAVMANAPGPLELLPTRQYRTHAADGTRRHWLRVSHPMRAGDKHGDRLSTPLGSAADPYTSIYLNNDAQCWWRLVKEELIDPAGRKAREKARREGKEISVADPDTRDFDKYAEVLSDAKTLHDELEDQYHPNTYCSYAADAKQPTWNEVHWQSASVIEGDASKAPVVEDDLNGTVKIKVAERLHMARIDIGHGPGDGTVPAESGAAPTPHAVQIFRHEGKAKNHASYDHQGSYKAAIVQAATLYSIGRIAADSQWLAANRSRA